MGLFTRRHEADLKASGGSGTGSLGAGGMASLVGLTVGVGRERAMSIPTISRARDVLASLIGSLPIHQYGTQWNGEVLEEIPLPPEPWMLRPDPNTTRAHILAWTFDDLFFHGRAYWYVSARYANGFPSAFQWLPAEYVSLDAAMFAGNMPIGSATVSFNGQQLARRDVIVFYSPVAGLLHVGRRAISTAERLDAAAERFAISEVPSGWLRQTGGEPMSGEELAALAEGFAASRRESQIAAFNEFVEYHESSMDPSRLQLVEARQYQALELSRLANVPAFVTGAPAGTGMTYQNARDARAQTVLFGALPYLECIEQTLSSEQVTPRGRIVRLNRDAWTDNPLDTPAPQPSQPESAPT